MNTDRKPGINFLPAAVIESLPIAIWATDLDFHLTHFIAAPELDILISGSSVIVIQDGRRGYDVRYPQHPDVAAHLRARAGETVTWQTGRGESARACVAPIKESDGKVVGVVGAAVDLAALREEEHRRECAEEVLYTLLDRGDYAAALLDKDDRVIYANETYLEAVGMPLREVLGNPEYPIMKDPSGENGKLAGEGEGPTSGRKDSPGNRFKSRRFAISQSGVDIKMHLAIDVSEVNAIRGALRRSERLYRAALEGIGKPASVVTLQGRIEGANREFAEMLKSPQRQIAGMHIDDFAMPSERDTLAALRESFGRGARGPVNGRLLFRVDGQAILGEVEIRPLPSPEGHDLEIWTVLSWGDPVEQMARTVRGSSNITEIDQKVLELLAAGYSNSEIASDLSLSRQGLDYRLKILRKRLRADSRGAIIARAYNQGLLDVYSWPPRCSPTAGLLGN
ncbi:PAS fold protein (plasmid) [Streptomyces sp. YIM 121038]|uniref:PAS domain S-box protein n=1 Tax=Streptomyces sp. YIM 121038 TaxID=2136401 RepID=UPI001110A5ED|nr:PAS domain S-box protein [Streptomyces sp. YIM 121038]QCX82593.1 PAS fold protein [Streptomyces sp. YIM 121038]